MRERNPDISEPPAGRAAFDPVAAEYDEVFTDTPLGRRQREIVHDYIATHLRPGWRVLELNCGTGEDAVWLAERVRAVVATDASEQMIGVAAAKAARSPFAARIELHRMTIEELRDEPRARELAPFDLVFSNFDGLNCLRDIDWLPEALRHWLVPGGEAVLVFMNPICLMEIAGAIGRGRFARAFQRLRREGVAAHIGGGATVRTWFHPVRRTVGSFARSRFMLRAAIAVGLFTPPTLMRTLYHRHQAWFRRLFRLEDLLAARYPFNRVGDHVLLHFKRQD